MAMATTKIWAIRGGTGIKCVLEYVENEHKTVMKLYTKDQDKYSEHEQDALEDVIGYAADKKKTAERKLVSGINCTVENAREEMMLTKKKYGKEDKIVLWHGYQSFVPGEVTPLEAHEIGVELARRLWGTHEVIVATHTDREHIHNHFVINSVSLYTGKKLDAKWQDLKRESDILCKEYGKSIVEHPEYKKKHYAEVIAEKNGRPTWMSLIKADVDEAIMMSEDLKGFLKQLNYKKYDYDYHGKYFRVRPPGKERFVRLDRRLGVEYTLDGIVKQIAAQKGRIRFVTETRTLYCRSKQRLPERRITGYQALYYKYLYKMGVLPKNTGRAARSNFIYREEILNLNKISESVRLMKKYDITTAADLKYQKTMWNDELSTYVVEQKAIRAKLKANDSPELKEKLEGINKYVASLRKNISLLDDIEERSKHMIEKEEKIDERKVARDDRTTGIRDDSKVRSARDDVLA